MLNAINTFNNAEIQVKTVYIIRCFKNLSFVIVVFAV